MEVNIIEIEVFKVRGYKLNGPLTKIPGIWERLNAAIAERGVLAEESFGVIMGMEGPEVSYLAGIKSDLTEELENIEEVIIPGGKFAVAKVEGGIPAIQEAFNTVMHTPGIRWRESFSFERYLLSEGSAIDQIEVWFPIE